MDRGGMPVDMNPVGRLIIFDIRWVCLDNSDYVLRWDKVEEKDRRYKDTASS